MYSLTNIKVDNNYNKNINRLISYPNEIRYFKKPFKPYEFPWSMMVYETPIYNIDYIGVLGILSKLI
jgi:hypothetical protein